MFWNKKKEIENSDICVIKKSGFTNLPPTVKSGDEVMYITGYTNGQEEIAVCSAIFVDEMLFITKNALERKTKQPNKAQKIVYTQTDILVAIKELNFKLRKLMSAPLPTDDVFEELTPQKENNNLH